ncbi:hypothetical protein BH20BAC1_BH20BAC1_11530 [soil metagenome]
MKKVIQFFKPLSAALIIAGALAACDSSTESTDTTTDSAATSMDAGMNTPEGEMKDHAEAALAGINSDTTVSGTVQFDKMDNGSVKMKLDMTVEKEANKTIAVHIHENGACGDMGKAAGDHFNPTNMDHGKWGSDSFHAGDIGNVQLDGNGHGTMEMETDKWSLGGDATTNILGKSIIVHSGTDDFTSQPSGAAGSRIGCATIQ